jgi:prepilin-type N-terminal cleavage/methylation domain-containing protein
MKTTKGFTLVELMVAMGVTVLLLVAVYVAINATQRHSAGIERRVLVMQDVKPALALMSVELSMASYNRFLTNGNWLVTDSATAADNCLNASPNQNYRGIQEATANVITVEMDATGNCSSNNDPACMRDPNEVINYTYDTANERITRETNCGGNQPFLGDTAASGRPRNLRVINNTLGLPLFRYFDGSGVEIPVANLPARIPDIRRIQIVLAVETEGIEPNTGQRKRLIYSSSVFVRNHAYTN